MKREEMREALAREAFSSAPWGQGPEAFMRHFEAVVEKALARVTPASRIQAAERAVVEAAEGVVLGGTALAIGNGGPEVRYQQQREAVHRLRALREQAGAEECSALRETVVEQDGSSIGPPMMTMGVRCDQPRGHEGKHSGDLGRWEWE